MHLQVFEIQQFIFAVVGTLRREPRGRRRRRILGAVSAVGGIEA